MPFSIAPLFDEYLVNCAVLNMLSVSQYKHMFNVYLYSICSILTDHSCSKFTHVPLYHLHVDITRRSTHRQTEQSLQTRLGVYPKRNRKVKERNEGFVRR